MGLDISHDAFHGAYSAFNRFRQFIAKGTGGSHPPHEDESLDSSKWYFGEGYSNRTHPGLFELLCHSDCDGEISPEMAGELAGELEELLPKLEEIAPTFVSTGHIAGNGGYIAVTKRFIEGCKEAHKLHEPLEFY